ncbi:MAG: M23 family metallopeptidase [Lachnospiraceae bacterium]|nr:M23 family metallopeptidase [Lachnospiraceae bacterium]
MKIYNLLVRLCLVCLIYGILLDCVMPNSVKKTSELDIKDINIRDMNPENKNIFPKELIEFMEIINKEIKYFPVAYSAKREFVEYVNSWGYERNYGGNRIHEGTDIMGIINERGIYPVVSVSDGVVEEVGWLELGGYRIGIRSEGGIYYYYAHLYSYNKGIEKGKKVRAGELIGYMGDSGYSKVEGTVGNFDVHLHFGIYVDTDEYGQLSINPYYFLKSIENNRIKYNY